MKLGFYVFLLFASSNTFAANGDLLEARPHDCSQEEEEFLRRETEAKEGVAQHLFESIEDYDQHINGALSRGKEELENCNSLNSHLLYIYSKCNGPRR